MVQATWRSQWGCQLSCVNTGCQNCHCSSNTRCELSAKLQACTAYGPHIGMLHVPTHIMQCYKTSMHVCMQVSGAATCQGSLAPNMGNNLSPITSRYHDSCILHYIHHHVYVCEVVHSFGDTTYIRYMSHLVLQHKIRWSHLI